MVGSGSYYRHGMALLAAVLLFVLIIYTLEKTGVPRVYPLVLSGIFALGLFIAGAFPAGTTRGNRFLVADRNTRPGINALATASLVGFPLLILNGGEMFFTNPAYLVIFSIAISGGLALANLLINRQFNQTQAADMSEVLLVHHNSTMPARLFAAANALAGIVLVSCGLAATAFLVSWFFAASFGVAMIVVVACCFLNAALGGIGSVTRFAAVSTVLLLLALNLPLLVHTLAEHGFPVGHLTAGVSAIQPTAELEQQLASLGIPLIDRQISNATSVLEWDAGVMVFAGLVVLLAVASQPSLVHQSAMNHEHSGAGTATRRGLIYAGLAMASMFALLAFTKIGFYQSLLGLTLSEARFEAPFLYSWGGRDIHLVEFCNNVLDGPDSVLTACADGPEHIINIPDFQLDGALLLAASPDIATLPFAFTALLTVSLIAVLTSFTSASLLALVSNLVTAFYASLPGKVASGRVFMVRMSLAIFLFVSTGLVVSVIDDFGTAFMFAMSLSCATSIPVLFSVFYLKRATPAIVSTAIGTGFALTNLFYVLSSYGIDFTPGTGDEITIRFPGMAGALPAELGAVIALPGALVVLVLMDALTRMLQGTTDTNSEAVGR